MMDSSLIVAQENYRLAYTGVAGKYCLDLSQFNSVSSYFDLMIGASAVLDCSIF